jgi:hypothetical protein
LNRISRLAATVAVAGATAMAGLAVGAGAAQAIPNNNPGFPWCPGEGLPFPEMQWDMNVCHTYYFVPAGTGNVPMVYANGSTMDSFISADIPQPELGPPPPPLQKPPGTPFCSPRGALIIIPPICDEIGVDLPPGSVKH